ncbi:MAG: S41 family peptidase [Bacteroidota bacterium]|nr:S41 family peptidase [Bacteroidota bacterium]
MRFSTIKRYIIIVLIGIFGLFVSAFKNDFFEIAKQIEIFTTLFKTVNVNYVDQTNPGQLMDKAIKNMLAELDPYTVFFNEADVVKFKINNSGEYVGIGAIVTRKNGKLILKEIYKDYAADKTGLKAGDEIIYINKIKVEDYKEDVSQLLLGAKNTKIPITYLRQNKQYETDITIDAVDVKAVTHYAKINDNTGYIALSQFNAKASRETRQALEDLKGQGIKQLILDLRGNPGGLLTEAVNICNLFVPKNEIITTTKSKNESHNNIYKTQFEPVDLTIPLVVIIDKKSASASEIVSGALQDLDRAVIVGTRSFGKGLVQKPIDLVYGTQLKVTVSRYYTPSGRCIQALDYTQKDEQGNAVRTESKNFNAFKTKKGRVVYDGGGILPDVEIEESTIDGLVDNLIKEDILFDYATAYYYKKMNTAVKTPVISDADFQDFKQWFKASEKGYYTETQKTLEKVLQVAKTEKIDKEIESQYNELLKTVQNANMAELEKHKTQIKKLLTEELVLRTNYREGLYKYYLDNSPEIKKSLEILNNQAQYNKILKK